MYRTFITLAILGFIVEARSQRHIIGSRLLDFDNPMRFVSPRIARQSKELKSDVVISTPPNVDSEQFHHQHLYSFVPLVWTRLL